MSFSALSERKMMEVSEAAISAMANSAQKKYAVAGARLLEDANQYRLWESEHTRIVGRVANEPDADSQIYTLREVAMAQIHRKSIFEVIRVLTLSDVERNFLINDLHGPLDTIEATISEHRNFVRATASCFCVVRIGSRHLHDAVFDSWIGHYEKTYNEYMSLYVADLLDRARIRFDPCSEFTPGLKQDLTALRKQILSLPRLARFSRSGGELRVPTGETVQLKRPRFNRFWKSKSA